MSEGQKRQISDQISMRPVVLPDDEDFLKDLYFTTREDEAVTWGLPEEQARALVEMQYRAQKMQFDAQYPDAQHEIVLYDGVPVGRLMSYRDEKEVFGVDLSILSEYRGKGIGTVVIKDLMRETEEAGKSFNFSVVKNNSKAIKLYKRLGVAFSGETISHYEMEWRPEEDRTDQNYDSGI